ncbi:MAG: RdgB/HAM1 family non-canonical purine NTP pyrophosphatase [Elusimicrobiaceae bacterium]|nr:RdgB/HAM1 family non-canonical purine NTP pyrophosphatase [Elusimicrobiaceae bacterium]
MKKLLIATENEHKARELAALMPELGLEYLTLRDFPGFQMPPEDGLTLAENAVIKARAAAMNCRLWALADDTGLEVDALGGAPGVFSARFAGPERDYAANNSKLLQLMAHAKKRTARFRCVMALASPDGTVITEAGVLEGVITAAPRGTNGFGYDPLFAPDGYASTLAEMPAPEKNRLSHRFNAVRLMAKHLKIYADGARNCAQ